MRKVVLLFILGVFALAGCQQNNDNKVRTIHNTTTLPLTAEGPLFAGSPVTFTKEMDLGMDSLLVFVENTDESLKGAKLKDAKITAISVLAEEGKNLDDFESFVLQFTGGEADMVKVASAESIKKNSSSVALTLGEQTDIMKFVENDGAIAVLDGVYANDLEEGEVKLTLKIEMDGTIAK